MTLQQKIEELFARPSDQYGEEYFTVFEEFKKALNQGHVRAAEPDGQSPTGWKVNAWVKKGILLGFRIGRAVEMSPSGFQFRDKQTYPLKQIPIGQNVRVVPGGSSIRDGCYIGKNVTCMPPMYVNAGAYVDDGTMIDSHALVGSCAQIGKRCHLSAAAQIGGVLEPVGALPVIIEDDVLVGGNCGVYEGAVVGSEAVLAAGTVLTGSTPVYDLVREKVYRREGEIPLMIPPGAVVVPGARSVTRGRGKEWALSLYAPVIIKYRDEKTDQAVRLEELLRSGAGMAESNQVTYTSRVRIERQVGPLRLAYLPAEKDPVRFGVHSEVAAHYKVSPEKFPPCATTLDYVVAAAGG